MPAFCTHIQDIMNTEIAKSFTQLYGEGGEIATYFCPGRVNLIGEHIDYNGGFVFPAALTLGITSLVRKRADSIVRFSSMSMEGTFEIDLRSVLEKKTEYQWANYPIGVLSFLIMEGYSIQGADVLFSSTLPDGAGVSSSAAIEVLTTYLFLYENGDVDPDKVWISRFAQKVENKFIGVNCGIMDQFSVANGKANQAILLNCNNLNFSYFPVQLGEYKLVILNTNKRRELAESKYNERRSECDSALAILRKHSQYSDLCSANMEAVNEFIPDPVLKARARHVITENNRVLEACNVLERGNLARFGELLNESHFSLRDDYEVTGKELDTITESARNHPACLGARMTGAGFGGCGIALVKEAEMAGFIDKVGQAYREICKLEPAFYVSEIGDGVRKLF